MEESMSETSEIVGTTDNGGVNVESASAGSACQTTKSNFAYILTGVVLGVACLLTIAIGLLSFAILNSAYGGYAIDGTNYGDSSLYFDDLDGHDEYNDYPDELDDSMEELLRELEDESGTVLDSRFDA